MITEFVWADYRPSKATWLWSCIGCAIATLVIGFTWGGWVTEQTAKRMVAEATDYGRARLARLCAWTAFLATPTLQES